MASEIVMSDPFEVTSSSSSSSPPPQAAVTPRKQWAELRQAVRSSRKLATSLLNHIPHSFTFRHIPTASGDTQTRLYYLCVPAGGRENTVLYIDIPPEGVALEGPESHRLFEQWKGPTASTYNRTQFSREEQLLRERKRLGSFGITSYVYHPSEAKFVYPTPNGLYYCSDELEDDGTLQTGILAAGEMQPLTGPTTSSRLDPKICPSNPDLIGFVTNSDVWVHNQDGREEIRLTFAHKGCENIADDPCSAGVPSFVVQEEFDRYTGFWWQPKQAAQPKSKRQRVYRLLYEEVDESDVEILHLASSTTDQKGVDDYRYPRAGTPNAKCTLKMVEFQINYRLDFVNVKHRELWQPLDVTFPWMEYIPRAGWTPDGNNVYVQVLDRKQQKLQLVLLPLAYFVYSDSGQQATVATEEILEDSKPEDKQDDKEEDKQEEDMEDLDLLSPPACVKIIYEEVSDIWVNVHDILHFFPQEDASEISFLWASEKTGFRHLYYVTSALCDHSHSERSTNGCDHDPHEELCRANVIKEVPITHGDWEVVGKQMWLDDVRKLVYFIGLKDTPVETHLYVVSYVDPGAITRLTQKGFAHSISVDKECDMFTTVYSSINQAPACELFRLDFSEPNEVRAQAVCTLLKPSALSEDYHPPEMFTFTSESGIDMCGMFYKPHNAEPGKKYPTIIFVYGGPQVQLVTNAHKSVRFLRLHTMASLGYAVIVLDSRGSCHRGLQFESHLQSRLGQVEVADQVEGLHWLAEQLDFIDLNRVAIHGWSYGGYLALMGLCQRPDVFKIAVAGAPVTSWNLYDTGYTERYMDTPQANPEGYKTGSVVDHVHNFPSELNRLLIVHGLIDENVHFFHTSALINALVKACKPYSLQVYPNERHGIRNPDASDHYETMVLSFLQQNL